MKTVGVIGGLGPETTSEFYLEIVFGCYQKNNEQISGFVDETFKRNKGLIYQFLGIKPIKELMG